MCCRVLKGSAKIKLFHIGYISMAVHLSEPENGMCSRFHERSTEDQPDFSIWDIFRQQFHLTLYHTITGYNYK